MIGHGCTRSCRPNWHIVLLCGVFMALILFSSIWRKFLPQLTMTYTLTYSDRLRTRSVWILPTYPVYLSAHTVGWHRRGQALQAYSTIFCQQNLSGTWPGSLLSHDRHIIFNEHLPRTDLCQFCVLLCDMVLQWVRIVRKPAGQEPYRCNRIHVLLLGNNIHHR